MSDIVVGLDIGTSYIKAVSLDKSSIPPKLLRYAMVPAMGIGKNIFTDSETNVESISGLVKNFIKDAGFSENDKVVAVIPENRVFSKVITMPILEGKEFEEAIRWEAEQHLPNALSDVYLKYTLIDQNQNKKIGSGGLLAAIRKKTGMEDKSIVDPDIAGTMDVLVVAASKVLVDKYMGIISKAGLTPMGIEPISISMIRSTVNEDYSPPTIIANLGQSNIDFYFAVRNSLRFVHMTNFGVESFVKAVSKQLDISNIHANEYVFTYGLKENELDGKIKELIMPIMNMLIQELKKIQKYIESRAQYFPDDETDKVVKRIIVAGGGALIPGMLANLASELNYEVQYANPWKAIDTSNIKMTTQLQELGPIFAAAIGAALK